MFVLASCSKSPVEEASMAVNDYEFYAYAPEAQSDSRTYVDAQKKLHWTKGDLITIFHGLLEPLKFGFRGETGATSGTYYNVDGIFYAPDQSAPNNVAIYPYSADHQLNDSSRAVTLSMPAVQTYAEDSFSLNVNTMVAVTSNVNDLALYFKNVGTYLNVRLWGNHQTVKSITITAKGGEALSGQATVTPIYGGDPTCVMAQEQVSPSVKLVCEEAVTVNTPESAPVSFWIVLPPVTMEQGFMAMVENAEGEIQEFAINQSVTFARNKYNTLTRELAIQRVPNNQFWYTSTDGKIVPPFESRFWGANIVSNIYENGKGIITFDGDIPSIGKSAFYADGSPQDGVRLTSISIPYSVTSIGGSAFTRCTSLKRVTIPSSVTSIGSNPFGDCSSLLGFYGKFASKDNRCLIVDGGLVSFAPAGLTEYTIPDGVVTIGFRAFWDADLLTEITIPDSVTSIEKYAFYVCRSLRGIVLPEGLAHIGESAFYYCQSLKEVYCKAVTPPTGVDHYTFKENNRDRTIYVPNESVNAYKQAPGWSYYAESIVGYNFD